MLVQIITENGQKKIIPLTADAGAGLPVGFVASAYKKGNYSGWLYCDGRDTTGTSEELSTHYPLLYTFLGGTNKLPDLREVGLKGAEKNTTYIFDSTETDPRTGQAGTQNHDVFTQGEFKDDQLQQHGHWSNTTGGGASAILLQGAGGNVIGTNAGNARTGTVTRGKSFAVYFYIKATSGLSENAQDNVINTLNEERSYSTEEHLTGRKWIDGKPTYEKTIDCGALPNNATKQVAHNITNIDEVIVIKGNAKDTSGTRLALPFTSAYDIANSIQVTVSDTNIGIYAGSNRSSYSGYITLEYTKTTD